MPGPADRRPLPWSRVETVPGHDPALVAEWRAAERAAISPGAGIRAEVGVALARYWDPELGRTRRRADAADLVRRARAVGDPTVLATTLLGRLYTTWGPDSHPDRRSLVAELRALAPSITDAEIVHRTNEWWVLDALDHGDAAAVASRITAHRELTAGTDDVLTVRRRDLWRATTDLAAGRIDRALTRYRAVLPAATPITGSPVSFQDAAVAAAIDWYFRSHGPELDESVRALIRNDPRVVHTWRAGLAFAKAETGDLDAARVEYDRVVGAGLDAIPRDLNWLVTMWLVAFTAADLEDTTTMDGATALLTPFADLDVTHGAGYATYGPLARALARLDRARGDIESARRHLEFVLDTRAPGPWTALARFELATLPAPDRRALERAADDFERWQMTPWIERARVATVSLAEDEGAGVARIVDGRWKLSYRGDSVEVADGVGVRHLVTLLARAHVGIPVVEIDGAGPAIVDVDSTQPDHDAQARSAYRRRLDRLLADAHPSDHDDEIDALRAALATATHRPSSSREIDRARIRVTRAVRRAIDGVRGECPDLADHLDDAVSTGRTCSYEPVDGRSWYIVRPASGRPASGRS